LPNRPHTRIRRSDESGLRETADPVLLSRAHDLLI